MKFQLKLFLREVERASCHFFFNLFPSFFHGAILLNIDSIFARRMLIIVTLKEKSRGGEARILIIFVRRRDRRPWSRPWALWYCSPVRGDFGEVCDTHECAPLRPRFHVVVLEVKHLPFESAIVTRKLYPIIRPKGASRESRARRGLFSLFSRLVPFHMLIFIFMISRPFFLLFPFSLFPAGELYAEARARRVVTFSRRKVLIIMLEKKRRRKTRNGRSNKIKRNGKKYTRGRTRRRVIR